MDTGHVDWLTSDLIASSIVATPAFSDIELDAWPLDVRGDYACVEWRVSMAHTGRLAVADGKAVEPTGVRVTLDGITVVKFHGGRMCSLRQYWDEL